MKKEVKKTSQKILTLLGYKQAKVTVADSDDSIEVNVSLTEEEMGSLIGHHGETISAIQRIVNLAANNGKEDWKRVVINVGDYRQKREEVLGEMAQQASQNAKTTGKEVILSYLPSHERRIIHMLLEKDGDIETYSEGVGNHRRLVIKPIN